MSLVNDIRIDDGGFLFKDGDFYVGASDQQHVEDILYASPGHFKEFAAVGVSIYTFLNSAGQRQTLSRLIKLQMEGDGYRVRKIDMADDIKNIYIDGERI